VDRDLGDEVPPQIVRLEQYYESDPTVLGLCGAEGAALEKYGINKIDDELLEQDVTVRVSVGLGAGDPQQRLAKFQAAASNIIAPISRSRRNSSPARARSTSRPSSKRCSERPATRTAAPASSRTTASPKGQTRCGPPIEELKAKIAKDERTGKAAIFTGLANLAKVALGKRELESDVVDMLLGHQSMAHQWASSTATATWTSTSSALDGHTAWRSAIKRPRYSPEHGDSFKTIIDQMNTMFTELYAGFGGTTNSKVTLRGPVSPFYTVNTRDFTTERGDDFKTIITQSNAMFTELYANAGGGGSSMIVDESGNVIVDENSNSIAA
jgi:hypothetical protein